MDLNDLDGHMWNMVMTSRDDPSGHLTSGKSRFKSPCVATA